MWGGWCYLVFHWFCCFAGIGRGQKSQFQPFWSTSLPCIAGIRAFFLLWGTGCLSFILLAPHLCLSLPCFLHKLKKKSSSIVQYLTSQSCKAVEMFLSCIKSILTSLSPFPSLGAKALLCYICYRGKCLQPYSAAETTQLFQACRHSGCWVIKRTISENSINLFFSEVQNISKSGICIWKSYSQTPFLFCGKK